MTDGEIIKVNGTEVKIKTSSDKIERPDFFCEVCEQHFPSELDLQQHKKIDHSKKQSVA